MITARRLAYFLLASCLMLAGYVAPAHAEGSWQAYISEESGDTITNTANCASGGVTGMRCRGWYCDDVGIKCTSISDTGARENFGYWISEENKDGYQNEFRCPQGYVVSGAKCAGGYCDNLAFSCVQVFGAMPESCAWEHVGEDSKMSYEAPAGSFITGVACYGAYCINKTVRVCPIDFSKQSMTIATNWKLAGSCQNCEKIEKAITVGVESTSERTKSQGWQLSVEAWFEATAGGDAAGGSVTGGGSVGFSIDEQRAVGNAIAKSRSDTTTYTCAAKDDSSIKLIYQYQASTALEGCLSADCSALINTEEILCIEQDIGGERLKPQCAPGTCADANCQTCTNAKFSMDRRNAMTVSYSAGSAKGVRTSSGKDWADVERQRHQSK